MNSLENTDSSSLQRDTRHGERHVIEVVTLLPVEDALLYLPFDAHVWLRLYTPDGKVESLGFYGECPIRTIWEAARHLVPRRGRVLSPDPREFTQKEHRRYLTPIELHEKQVKLLKAYIQELREDESYTFQVFNLLSGRNCVGFVRDVFERLELPAAASNASLGPQAVLRWQLAIEAWRQAELEVLQGKRKLVEQKMLDAIRYGLPPGGPPFAGQS